jgi:hypothetical protein
MGRKVVRAAGWHGAVHPGEPWSMGPPRARRSRARSRSRPRPRPQSRRRPRPRHRSASAPPGAASPLKEPARPALARPGPPSRRRVEAPTRPRSGARSKRTAPASEERERALSGASAAPRERHSLARAPREAEIARKRVKHFTHGNVGVARRIAAATTPNHRMQAPATPFAPRLRAATRTLRSGRTGCITSRSLSRAAPPPHRDPALAGALPRLLH